MYVCTSYGATVSRHAQASRLIVSEVENMLLRNLATLPPTCTIQVPQLTIFALEWCQLTPSAGNEPRSVLTYNHTLPYCTLYYMTYLHTLVYE